MPKNPFNWGKDGRGSTKYKYTKYKKLRNESPSPPRHTTPEKPANQALTELKEQLPPKPLKIVEQKNLITFD